MTATAVPTFDVFISHGWRDRAFATEVSERLKAQGLQPFHDADIIPGDSISETIWDAIAECVAFLVILSPNCEPDAMGLVEFGAAKAWNKPIYVLLNGSATMPVPEFLQDHPIYPKNRLDEVLFQIRRTLEAMTDRDRQVLLDVYQEQALPVDDLNQSPDDLQHFEETFQKRAHKHFAGTRLLSELLRLRKHGKLPRFASSRRRAKL
jgi:hypothetical protein